MDSESKIIICSISPYFLEKGLDWFEENSNQIIKSKDITPFFQDNVLLIEKDQKYSLSELLRKLDEMGYEKVYNAESIGEFSQKGGILDIFPINLNKIVRLDFLGNNIDNIELLNPNPDNSNSKNALSLLKKKLKSQKTFSDLKGVKSGDYLVHLDHGVAKFYGIESLKIANHAPQDFYVLEYAKGDRLFVPLGLERKLSRYVGFAEPKILSLGSQIWQKTKKKIKEEAEKLAKELLEIYANRTLASRPPYEIDSEIQRHIIETFEHEETPDQMQAIKDIQEDMQKTEPMDRLVCGDVGFGKTEVALRASVMAASSGRQTAIICPTTLLANQHFQNFKTRLKETPLKIAILSRLQPKQEQKKIIEDLKKGLIDIVIATHRLLSKDIQFRNLGLLIIDDEQRFGVKQKEKFKQARASLDILSLSATPIPRTLYMAMSSLKNTSLIQTPPHGRLPVKTVVLPFKNQTIKEAIERELNRQGQVYFLYNRVATIHAIKKFLENLSPKASPNWRIAIAHGRMQEKELIKVINDFDSKKIDVLVATTIIESGLDFSNANTLIVADSGKLGLSQAYQIRGRVGRSSEQSFAYFLYPKGKLSPLGRLRLEALKEAQSLGSGYRIALRDLEIRGAGNILGREQSGNINKVGLNLYCQMLSEAVEKLRQ